MKISWARLRHIDLYSAAGGRTDWITMKISLVCPVVLYLIFCLNRYHAQPFPMGVCRWMDCTALLSQPVKGITIALLLILAGLYIAERAMIWCLLGLSILCIIILSLDESNAGSAENGIISLIFIMQLCAYLMSRFNTASGLAHNRVQFPIQIVAAVYTLSAISKLHQSGINWFLATAPNFVLEIERVFYDKYTATGQILYMHRGDMIAAFMMHHIYILRFMLFIALAIEAFAVIMLLGRAYAFIYGFWLLALHLGIYLLMGIFFPTIMVPMMVVTINPLYFTVIFFNKIIRSMGTL